MVISTLRALWHCIKEFKKNKSANELFLRSQFKIHIGVKNKSNLKTRFKRMLLVADFSLQELSRIRSQSEEKKMRQSFGRPVVKWQSLCQQDSVSRFPFAMAYDFAGLKKSTLVGHKRNYEKYI